MLWLVFALISIATIVLLILPVLKGGSDARPRVDYDIVVYRSQLTEIDSDVEQGVMTQDQAEAARAEVHRRMLAAEDAELKQPLRLFTSGSRISRILTAVAIAVILPVGAVAMYAKLGSPALPGKPYLWRVHNDPEFATAATADQIATQLQNHPTADGFAQLGRTLFAARQYEQAAAAYRKAFELGTKDAVSWSEFGEAVVMSNGGVVAPEAMTAFFNALAVEPKSERSRFYLGLAEAQIGNYKQAVAIWKDLEKTSDPSAPWLSMLREHIQVFAKQGGFDPATVEPSPPDVKAMGTAMTAMSKAMQAGPHGAMGTPSAINAPPGQAAPVSKDPMVIAMVERLADKLEKNPSDVAGWQRLAHAYIVTGELTKAQAAAMRAVKLKPADVGVQLSLAEVQKAASPNEETPKDFIATLKKVLTLDPANTEALFFVGLSEARAGRPAEAKALWTKALATAKADDPLTGEIKTRLSALPDK